MPVPVSYNRLYVQKNKHMVYIYMNSKSGVVSLFAMAT